MSAPEAVRPPVARPVLPPVAQGAPRGTAALSRDARFFASELRLVLGRRRNQVVLGVLVLVTTLIGVAIKLTTSGGSGSGGGPAFLSSITENGLFLAFTALVVCLPVFMPLAVSVVAGEAVAGEANTGTLRYLLVTPVNRTRLLVVKYLAAVTYGLVAALGVAVTGVVVGALLFPIGDITLLSGTTVSYGDGLLRLLAVALYVAGMLATVAALGLLVSTLTEVPIAAMSATAIAVVLVQIMAAVPQLSAIRPWLFSSAWLDFGDLLRDPVSLDGVTRGLALQAGWIVVLLGLAWARMTSKDVTS